MLNFDASYVHSTYFLKRTKVRHIKKLGDLVVTSGNLLILGYNVPDSKSKGQEMDLKVPVGIHPVLLDEKERLVNIIFNPSGNIELWDMIKFKNEKKTRSFYVNECMYGFVDKNGFDALTKDRTLQAFLQSKLMSCKSVKKGYELKIINSGNNYVCVQAYDWGHNSNIHAGYNESLEIQCISGCLLGMQLEKEFRKKIANQKKSL